MVNNVVYVDANLYELDLFVEARSSNTNLLSVANGIKVATRQKENNKRRRHEKKELRTRLNISTFMFWKKDRWMETSLESLERRVFFGKSFGFFNRRCYSWTRE